MRVEFERRGGVTGVVLRASADLTDDEAARLLACPRSPGPAAPDRFHYSFAVDDGTRTHRVSLNERDIPPDLRPLVARLTGMAQTSHGAEEPRRGGAGH